MTPPTLSRLILALTDWRTELAQDVTVRICVIHPLTGERMLFDIEGADAWEGEEGLVLMLQNFPPEKEPHLKLVPSG